ncbi:MULTISPECIES: photosystem II reaction center protein Psb28 [unclassified Picosynechococcus]|uniref:photosystem II reaction center protein Psb28 n=1 Tax=unclassified Picosynechococcus TaxID=3079910 RepID=UPI00081075F7|nr:MULTISPECIES: photosystem II reaction center protein Psb28 [unclassified Picosynechococcus]ANV90329.1 photosystem II reaction center protein Psb28 [Picosynechococcus sp. PCC 8807]QCS49880.1 photosystem II reaction center protein Psb28 [Picosynechococcus sp. PCC 11901]
MFNFFKNKQTEPAAPPPPQDPTPRIEFFNGISEELSNVSLQRNPKTGVKSVSMTFAQLNALDRFQSFTAGSNGIVRLIDEEGDIAVTPSSCRIVFGGEEGDELRGVICRFEIDNADHWERFMRFMHRYADEHGFAYGESAETSDEPSPLASETDSEA